MPLSSRPHQYAVALFALTTVSASADSGLICESPAEFVLPVVDATSLFDDDIPRPPGVLQLASGAADVTMGGNATLSDGVVVKRNENYLAADQAEFDAERQLLSLNGSVRYSGIASQVQGEGAEFDLGLGRIRFTDSRFALPDGRGRGVAGLLELDQTGLIQLGEVEYTSCPVGDEDWEINASQIRLNTADGIGTARNLKLEFFGVPILYAPWLSFPISDARKTGFLIPNFGTSGRNGTDISAPYYWNIKPNYDATFTPRLMSKRGLQLDSEFRYLTNSSAGRLNVAFLNDNEFNDTRIFSAVENRTYLPRSWRMRIDAEDVTDDDYFEDLGDSQSSASTTFLNRSLVFDRPGKTWDLEFRAQAFQTLDDTLTANDEPYRQLPQLLAHGRWPGMPGGLNFDFRNELTNFDRDTGVTGWRYNVESTLGRPFERHGIYLKPELSHQYTLYRLENTAAGADASPDRELPTFSFDAGAIFERKFSNRSGWLQTLEPRILYVHTPFREQDQLPVFDTIVPDFNLIQIFRKRPLTGVDRVLDLDQLSFGLTSRIIESETGETLLSATIGQTRFLSEQGVGLPNTPGRSGESSDYIAEVDINLYDHWNLEFGHQWNSDRTETVKSEFRLQYQPASNRILNLAYRFRRDSLEQVDLSWSWPIAERWNTVGRYNYSLRDDTTLERFVGVEYESCCWAVRLVSRRYISRRDGTADSSIALQLELKGLTSVGDPAGKLLERGILGYKAN